MGLPENMHHILRTFPINSTFFSIFNVLHTQEYKHLVFLVGSYFMELLNDVLKVHIAKPIFDKYGTKKGKVHELGSLGRGERPMKQSFRLLSKCR